MQYGFNVNANGDNRLTQHRNHGYIEKHPEIFKSGSLNKFSGLSHYRWTLDEPRDYEFLQRVFSRLYQQDQIFLASDVLALLETEPELMQLNCDIVRNEGYLKSLIEDGNVNVQS